MTAKLTKELHVRMNARDSAELATWAEAESRSVSAQVVHILRQALAERAGLAPLSSDQQLADRIRHAPREAN